VSFLSFGSYFAYDSVSATGTYIMTDLWISESEFGLLYSVYSFPNIILVLVGGYLIDKVNSIERQLNLIR
jgi:MFS family permease